MQGGKREGAGRPKGSRNKRTIAVLDKLESVSPEYCPIVELARIALDPETPLQVRVDCHKTIASYTVPKIKPLNPSAFKVDNKAGNDYLDGLLPF